MKTTGSQHFIINFLMTVFLIAVALLLYHYFYKPAYFSRKAQTEELQIAARRQIDKQNRLMAMREKCLELENGDPETISEVIRQELNKGAADEYFK